MRQLALLVVALFITLNGWALSFTVDSINYSTTGTNTIEVAKGRYSGAITIPSSVAYDNSTYTVTAIGKAAFDSCAALTTITIPLSVTSIGDYAFFCCTSLTSIDIPSSVTRIGNLAFCRCSVLSSINIPFSVTSIGISAFWGCTGLTSITIPSLVISIGDYAFKNCTGLISVDSNNPNYSSKDGVLFNKNPTTLIQCPISIMGNYNIPSSVTSIGNVAFYGCTGLTSIVIPSSVTSIGRDAFVGCTGLLAVDSNNPNYSSKDGVLFNKNLTSLIQCPISVMGNYNIPSSVTSIGEHAFYGCSGLTSIVIPSSVTSIGNYALDGCTGLISVDSNNPKYSSKDGVLFNKNLTTLIQSPISVMGNYVIPSSVTSIEALAFCNCTVLTSITVPSSVTSIGNFAFGGCTGLITVDSNNANYSSKDGVLYNKNHTTLIQCPKSIMGNFNIPSSATRIEQRAFEDCNGLTSITIPSSVKSIQDCAFIFCTSLSSLKMHATTPPLLGEYVFSKVNTSKFVLYVPTGSLSVYKAANQWKDFKTILEFDPTGIADVNLKSFLSNRTQSYVTIELGEPSSNAQIIVVNALGQTVYECQTSDERISIDVSHFLAGMYFIDVKGENNRILRVGKFIKQ